MNFARLLSLAFALGLGMGALSAGEVRDAFKPGELWPDDHGPRLNAHGDGILRHEGVYYWYGEHKIGGEIGNTAPVGVHVYSSTDLYNWKDRGTAFRVSGDPKSEYAKGCGLERPKVIDNEKTRKFVRWFHLEFKRQDYKQARTALAASDAPEQIATAFESQSTHVPAVRGNPGAFVNLGDRWRPSDASDGRYIWLPIEREDGKPILRCRDSWKLGDRKTLP